MEDEIITDVECTACNAVYTLTFDTRELRGDLIETVSFISSREQNIMNPLVFSEDTIILNIQMR